MGWAPQKIKCTHKIKCWGLTPCYFQICLIFFHFLRGSCPLILFRYTRGGSSLLSSALQQHSHNRHPAENACSISHVDACRAFSGVSTKSGHNIHNGRCRYYYGQSWSKLRVSKSKSQWAQLIRLHVSDVMPKQTIGCLATRLRRQRDAKDIGDQR
jgi:hypothetical protein